MFHIQQIPFKGQTQTSVYFEQSLEILNFKAKKTSVWFCATPRNSIHQTSFFWPNEDFCIFKLQSLHLQWFYSSSPKNSCSSTSMSFCSSFKWYDITFAWAKLEASSLASNISHTSISIFTNHCNIYNNQNEGVHIWKPRTLAMSLSHTAMPKVVFQNLLFQGPKNQKTRCFISNKYHLKAKPKHQFILSKA